MSELLREPLIVAAFATSLPGVLVPVGVQIAGRVIAVHQSDGNNGDGYVIDKSWVPEAGGTDAGKSDAYDLASQVAKVAVDTGLMADDPLLRRRLIQWILAGNVSMKQASEIAALREIDDPRIKKIIQRMDVIASDVPAKSAAASASARRRGGGRKQLAMNSFVSSPGNLHHRPRVINRKPIPLAKGTVNALVAWHRAAYSYLACSTSLARVRSEAVLAIKNDPCVRALRGNSETQKRLIRYLIDGFAPNFLEERRAALLI